MKPFITLILLCLLSSCNPYQGLYPTATANPSATETVAKQATARATMQPIKAPAPLTCKVTTNIPDGHLNIRTGAGVRFSVIQILREGRVLTVTGNRADTRGAQWIEVTTNHLTGWVNKKYCK